MNRFSIGATRSPCSLTCLICAQLSSREINAMEYRLLGIAKIESERVATRDNAIEQVRAMQATCPHDHVVASSQFGGRRICAACGLEEATTYSWPSRTIDGGFYEFVRPSGQPTVLNSEFVKIGDVCRHRVRV